MTARNFGRAVVVVTLSAALGAGAAFAVWWNTYTVTVTREFVGGMPVTTVCVGKPSHIFPSRDGLIVIKTEACTEDNMGSVKVY